MVFPVWFNWSKYAILLTARRTWDHADIYNQSECESRIRYGVVANIIASHAIARGSIPRVGSVFLILDEASTTRLINAYAVSHATRTLQIPHCTSDILSGFKPPNHVSLNAAIWSLVDAHAGLAACIAYASGNISRKACRKPVRGAGNLIQRRCSLWTAFRTQDEWSRNRCAVPPWTALACLGEGTSWETMRPALGGEFKSSSRTLGPLPGRSRLWRIGACRSCPLGRGRNVSSGSYPEDSGSSDLQIPAYESLAGRTRG